MRLSDRSAGHNKRPAGLLKTGGRSGCLRRNNAHRSTSGRFLYLLQVITAKRNVGALVRLQVVWAFLQLKEPLLLCFDHGLKSRFLQNTQSLAEGTSAAFMPCSRSGRYSCSRKLIA